MFVCFQAHCSLHVTAHGPCCALLCCAVGKWEALYIGRKVQFVVRAHSQWNDVVFVFLVRAKNNRKESHTKKSHTHRNFQFYSHLAHKHPPAYTILLLFSWPVEFKWKQFGWWSKKMEAFQKWCSVRGPITSTKYLCFCVCVFV